VKLKETVSFKCPKTDVSPIYDKLTNGRTVYDKLTNGRTVYHT